MEFDAKNLQWIREPEEYSITQERIEIITKAHTDLWQRTYYHFRNDNAPVLQMSTRKPYFLSLSKQSLRAATDLTSAAWYSILTAKTG